MVVCPRSVKLGVMEDPSNRSRLAKLLRFHSSRADSQTFLADYVARMKPGQNHIYYIAGASRAEVSARRCTLLYQTRHSGNSKSVMSILVSDTRTDDDSESDLNGLMLCLCLIMNLCKLKKVFSSFN